jgi:hypothetical protein
MRRGGICILLSAIALMLLFGCGGDGGSGSGSGTGTVALDIADAKPFIDGAEPDELWLVFDEVLVHQSGGGWVPLVLPETPFEINLLAFSDGLTTEFATPTRVPAGHITQIRFVIERAYMVFYGEPDPVEIDRGVPSGVLRTDKQCDWTVEPGGALHYTVHFDLSQSIVETGVGEYKLKPVIHLFDNSPDEAAEICGWIAGDSFVETPPDPPDDVIVTVIWDPSESEGDEETYTRVWVAKDTEHENTEFCIFWLVPLLSGESYTVQIDNGFATVERSVQDHAFEPGEPFYLDDGNPIDIPVPPPPPS